MAAVDTPSVIVNEMLHAARSGEEDTNSVFKLDATAGRNFDGGVHHNVVVAEVRVHAHAVALKVFDVVAYFESMVAFVGIVILRDVVWELTLVEVSLTLVTVPLDHITKCVLCEKTVGLNLVTVNLETGLDVVTVVLD